MVPNLSNLVNPARNNGTVHCISVLFSLKRIDHHMGGHSYRDKWLTSRWSLTIPKTVLESLRPQTVIESP